MYDLIMSCVSPGLIGVDNKISNNDEESISRASHARDLAIREVGGRGGPKGKSGARRIMIHYDCFATMHKTEEEVGERRKLVVVESSDRKMDRLISRGERSRFLANADILQIEQLNHTVRTVKMATSDRWNSLFDDF